MLDESRSLGRLHPEQYEALQEMQRTALETDPELVELCFGRVLEIIGAAPEAERSEADLDARERAFLAFSEQFAFSVAAVSDADIERLLEHAEPVEAYAFIAALYSLEMSARIELASRAVLADRGGSE